MIRVACALSCLLFLLGPICEVGPAAAQTLDQKAWNAVWDRLEGEIKNRTDDHIAHVLQYPIPMTWAGDERRDARRQLASIAGIVPQETFSIDPSMGELRLHDRYLAITGDVAAPPELSTADRRKLDDATGSFREASDDLLEAWESVDEAWGRYKERLESVGEIVTSRTMDDFYRKRSGRWLPHHTKLRRAFHDFQRLAPLSQFYTEPLIAVMQQVLLGSVDTVPWDYNGDWAVGGKLVEDCDDEGDGWQETRFDSDISSSKIRNRGWSAGGSFGGDFFSVGLAGGSKNYEKVIQTKGEYISLRFCKLDYINLEPGDWFSMDLLQRLDSGLLPFRSGSESAKLAERGVPVLGPNGRIPRMVSGLVVARRIVLEAKLDQRSLDEVRKSSGGGGGLRIGPFKIGGKASKTSFDRKESTQNGAYRLSTGYEVPVILAVVTESTAPPAPLAPSLPVAPAGSAEAPAQSARPQQ